MRLAIPLVSIALIGAPAGASAQAIPGAEDKETLRIYADAMVADDSCPAMRINLPQLHAYLESRGMSAEIIFKKYPELYAESSSMLAQAVRERTDYFCQYFLDELGDFGVHPHILVHR